jgi:hypothetical protein
MLEEIGLEDMSVPHLNQTDLGALRTQKELDRWVTDILSGFASTKKGRSAFRLNKGNLVKQLVEEMLPLMRFANGFYSENPDLLFQLVIGNQSYDALVRRADREIAMHLQITQSFDGYQNYLRKLHLNQHSFAPITQRPLAKDKRTGQVERTQGDTVDPHRMLANTFSNIRRAVERKSKMRYEEGTCLIVNVESFHFHTKQDTIALDKFVHQEVVPHAHTFGSLCLVSDTFAYRYPTNAT